MGLIQQATGTLIAAIMIGGVSIPVVNEVINSGNYSGTTALIMGFVPVGLAASLLYASFRPFMG